MFVVILVVVVPVSNCSLLPKDRAAWQLITISADFPLIDSPICCTDVLQSAIVFPEAAKLEHHVSECESRES